MYVEPPAMAGGQKEDGNIGMDAEIEVDEEEVFIYYVFMQLKDISNFLDQEVAIQSGRDPRGIKLIIL